MTTLLVHLSWLITLCFRIQGQEVSLPEYVVSECYGDTFNFDCGSGNMIRINQDFFGYSDGEKCEYHRGDCTMSNPKSNSLIHRYCTGKRWCTYYMVERRACDGFFTNYQQVEYQCVPETKVVNVCEAGEFEAYSAYIASPKFPNVYPPNLDCSCVVTAKNPGVRVQMEIVYLAIKFNTPCQDWLKIGRKRTCGTTVDLYSGKVIPIEFHTDGESSHTGFWLHFQASKRREPLIIRCGHNVTADYSDLHRKRRPAAATTPLPRPASAHRVPAASQKQPPPTARRAQPTYRPGQEILEQLRAQIHQHRKASKRKPTRPTLQPRHQLTQSTLTSDPQTHPTSSNIPNTAPTFKSSASPITDRFTDITNNPSSVPVSNPTLSSTQWKSPSGQQPTSPRRPKPTSSEARYVPKTKQSSPETEEQPIIPDSIRDISHHAQSNSIHSSLEDLETSDSRPVESYYDVDATYNGLTPESDDLYIPQSIAEDHEDKFVYDDFPGIDLDQELEDTSLDYYYYYPEGVGGNYSHATAPADPERHGAYTLGLIILGACTGLIISLVVFIILLVYCRRRRLGQNKKRLSAPDSSPPSSELSTSQGENDNDSGQGLLVAVNHPKKCSSPTSSTSDDCSSPHPSYTKGSGHQSYVDVDSLYAKPICKSDRHSSSSGTSDAYEDVVVRQSPIISDSDGSLYCTPTPLALDRLPTLKKCSTAPDAIARPRYIGRRKRKAGGRTSQPNFGCYQTNMQFNDSESDNSVRLKQRPRAALRVPNFANRLRSDSEPDLHSSSEQEQGDLLRQRSIASLSELAEVTFVPDLENLAYNDIDLSISERSDDTDWETKSAVSI